MTDDRDIIRAKQFIKKKKKKAISKLSSENTPSHFHFSPRPPRLRFYLVFFFFLSLSLK